MEVSLLMEPANKLIKKSILDSNSNHLPTQSRDGEQVLAEQESENKCNHFTIRHYVSEVRKKNAKICLPFPKPDQSSADHAKALPPLQVKIFRRWDCRRCTRLIVAPKTMITNGVSPTSVIQNGANMTSQSDHQSKNHDTLRVLRDATMEVAKSFAETESSALIKEGIRQSKVCYHRSEADQNRTSKPDAEACQTREKGAITVRASSSRFALPSEDNPKILSSKWGKTVLVHLNDISSDKEEDQRLSKIGKGKEFSSLIDLTVGALPSPPDHISHNYSKNSDECNEEESDTSIHFIDARKQGVCVDKSLPRRVRKIRTINDIMESAASRKVDKNRSSSENISATVTPEASKDNDEHPKHGGHQIQDMEPMSIKRKEKDAVSNDGDGTCLIQWLKKVPKKARLHKGQLEVKDINNATGTSECASLKGLYLNFEYSARGEKKKEIIEEKQRNKRPEVVKSSFKPQQKGRAITEDLLAKNLHSRSLGISISEKDFRHKSGTIENNDKKTLLGNKKNKRPYLEEGPSSQPRCFKDSLGILEQAFAQTREVKRKQRTIWTPRREDVDGIPMDIVEHLAKKQHEKYLMNTQEGSSSLCKLPESIENVKNLNGCSNGGYDARISTKYNGDTESISKSKQYPHLFDLNQEAPTCASTELRSPSPYIGLSMSGAQLTIIDSNRNYFPQNLSAVGMKTLPFRSDHTNQTVSPQNLFGNVRDGGSFGSLTGYPSHISEQNIPCSFAYYPSRPESRNVCYSNLMAPEDLNFDETMCASSFLRIVNQSAHSGDPQLSLLRNGYTNKFNSHGSEFLQSEIENDRGGNMCKPLRPLPRIGILGPLLQKEIINTTNNMRPTLGFGANSQLSFHNTSFIASRIPKPPTPHKTTQTSISLNESWRRIENNGQVLTESRNGAFQPLKSAYKMEECVVNRNPADFAMVDEDSEYMIGYKETKAKPHPGKLQSRAHIRGQKGQKMRKLSEIKRSRKSKKASSREKV